MFHLVLSVTVDDANKHHQVYTSMGQLQDLYAGAVPSVNLSSYDMSSTLPDTEELYIDEDTMIKAIEAIYQAGITLHAGLKYTEARVILDALQKAGILFRERRKVEE